MKNDNVSAVLLKHQSLVIKTLPVKCLYLASPVVLSSKIVPDHHDDSRKQDLIAFNRLDWCLTPRTGFASPFKTLRRLTNRGAFLHRFRTLLVPSTYWYLFNTYGFRFAFAVSYCVAHSL